MAIRIKPQQGYIYIGAKEGFSIPHHVIQMFDNVSDAEAAIGDLGSRGIQTWAAFVDLQSGDADSRRGEAPYRTLVFADGKLKLDAEAFKTSLENGSTWQRKDYLEMLGRFVSLARRPMSECMDGAVELAESLIELDAANRIEAVRRG
jgi:hypothetical protein